MSNDNKIDRKQFLTLSLAVAGGAILGCASGASGDNTGTAGKGGTSGTGGGTAGAGGGSGSTAGAGGGAGSAAGASGHAGSTAGTAGAGGSGTAGGGGTGGAAANCGTSLKITITNNHGHVLTITMAEISADQTKVYSTMGTATHDHFVQITGDDFKALAMGKELRKPSCNDDHEHEFIINCVGTDGVPDPNVAAYCGDPNNPSNRTCGESMTHTCAGGPYPTV
jgi:hypothetical protein